MSEGDTQELLLFVDWLGLSIRLGGEVKPIEGYVWKEYSATNVWASRRVLWTDGGDRVCTLLSQPRSSILDSKAALLEIENEWLYHGLGPEGIISLLLKSFPFEITGISRLDLACDFEPTEEQRDIIMGLSEGRYYVGGKRSGSGFWSTNTAPCLHRWWTQGKIPHSQSWGHKTSSIKWKLYYKTRELWEAGGWKFPHKPYIIDQWRCAGFDCSNVWRLEVSCKHLNDLQLYGQIMDLANLTRNRGSFYVSMYLQRFIIRCAEGHRDRSNDRIVPFLPVMNVDKGVSQTPAKSLAKHSGRITLLRHLVQSLDDEHIYLDERTRHTVFQAISDIVERDRLDNYFRVITGKWLDDYISDKESEANGEYDTRFVTCKPLPIDDKGSTPAERAFDMPDWRIKYQFAPNIAFDEGAQVNHTYEKSDDLKTEEEEVKRKVKELSDQLRKNKPPDSPTLNFGDTPS